MAATLYLSPMTGRQPDYAARRAVAALILAVTVVLGAITASTLVTVVGDVGGRPAAATDIAASAGEASAVGTHIAQPGDTLWSIARRYRGEVAADRYVDALIGLNGGTVIQVGQAVRLP